MDKKLDRTTGFSRTHGVQDGERKDTSNLREAPRRVQVLVVSSHRLHTPRFDEL